MKRLLVVAALGLSLTACGGSPADKVARPGVGVVRGENEQAAKASAPASPGASAAASPSPKRSAVATPSNGLFNTHSVRLPPDLPDHVEGSDHAPLEIEMSACVARPGIQRITVRSRPGYQISWATMFADGNAHREWTAFGVGVIPPTGVYTAQFTVPAAAPVGETRTDFAAAGRTNGKDATAWDHAYWKVLDKC